MKFKKQFWVDNLGEKWAMQLKDTLKSEYSDKLMNFITAEYALNKISPSQENIFKAYKLCPWESLRIVILDQMPHLSSEANGLAYGDTFTTQFHSPTLSVIHSTIEKQYSDGLYLDFDFTMERWAKQGILLLCFSPGKDRRKLFNFP